MRQSFNGQYSTYNDQPFLHISRQGAFLLSSQVVSAPVKEPGSNRRITDLSPNMGVGILDDHKLEHVPGMRE